MNDKYRNKHTLQSKQMNACSLDFPDEKFNVFIAKGTGEGSTATARMAELCSEVSRVLKPNGCFFIVTYGIPVCHIN